MEMSNKNNTRKDIDLLVEDLKRLESHTEDLWHFLPIPVCLLNPAFNIVNTSKAFEEVSGYEELEIIGENLKDFLKDFEETKEELNRKKRISGKEAIFLTREKKEIPVNLSAKVREDEKGDVTGYFFAFINLSEIKEKEKELQNKVKELEKLNKLAIGRELKMVALKKEIERIKKELRKRSP
jgi:PAS domain S-box-containing protein